MMKRAFLLLLAIGVSVMLCGKVTLLSTRGTELIAEFTLDDWQVVPDGDFSRIIAEGMDYRTTPGAPLLPYDEFKVGLPPSGGFTFHVLESTKSSVTLPSRLIPAPLVTMKDGLSNFQYIADESKYHSTDTELISVLSTDTFRGYSFAIFQVNPFSYNGKSELQVITKAIVRIELSGDLNYRSGELSDTATDIFARQLLNETQALSWRSQPRNQVNFAPFANSDWWLRIETNREGIYRLNPSQISALPLQDIDPRLFRLFSTSGKVISDTVNQLGPEFREVPILVAGEEDGSFDSGDYILFYGRSRDGYDQNAAVISDGIYNNPYSQNQVFWLTFGQNFKGDPKRIMLHNANTSFTKFISSTPAVKHVESEVQRRDDIGFTWYGSRFFGNTTADYVMQTELSEVDVNGAQNLTFRVCKEDVADQTQNTIQVEVNGTLLVANAATGSYNFSWYGTNPYTFNRDVTGFVNGTNTIKIRVLRSTTNNIFFDWYRISYMQNLAKGNAQKTFNHPTSNFTAAYKFSLTGSFDNMLIMQVNDIYNVQLHPLQDSAFVGTGTSSTRYFLLTAAETFAPASIQLVEPKDLTADTSQMDNVIICSPDFLDSAQALAEKYWDLYRVRSRVILQDDIFTQFNGGHPDPAAIRQAMRYFYYSLPAPKLSSLTLMGLGTSDWRNYSGGSAAKNHIIVWQQSTTVSDDYFGMISSSYYPELAIGRYPVKNQNELNVMLQNLSNYTDNPTPGWWRNSMVFLGDDLNNGNATYEYIHTQQTEEVGNLVNPSILPDKIFAMEYEYDEFQNKPKARDDFFAAINEGRLLSCYIGHGSYDKLGAEDYLNGATDMNRFTNSGKLTFFIASSCKVSHFDYWGFESLGQKVVLLNDRGAIASYAATRISYPDNNQPMLKFLIQSLANGRNPLGYAVMDAKIRYTGNNINDATYILMGDPVLRVVTPVRDSTMQVTGQGSFGVFSARETVQIEGSFLAPQMSGETQIKAFGSKSSYSLGPLTTVSHRGRQLYLGSADVEGSAYDSGFVVPDDVSSGNTGLVVSYFWDEAAKKDYTNYLAPVRFSDTALSVDNPDAPDIKIFLGSYDFRSGDTVSTSTSLYARISDSNGINITGAPGHNILLVIDNSLQPISITPYFSYDKGSYTSGSLVYPLPNLSEGSHTVKVIAFDNFNLPAVASVSFEAKRELNS
ncbi:MAG: C25 family cysteine peptidase [Candidatus Cloacimonetes bacterium]|nr:C25 family cysteine peptidase [Candidatus Cloacimonadota bacterium]